MENSALSANRLPEQIAGEMIMLAAGIEFTAKSGAHKFHAGHVDDACCRLRRSPGSFQAFDLPLATMRASSTSRSSARTTSRDDALARGQHGLDDINWKIAFNNGALAPSSAPLPAAR